MLKFGQFKLFRKHQTNENYETTIIEENYQSFEEDQYQLISPLNQRIIEEIKSRNSAKRTSF